MPNPWIALPTGVDAKAVARRVTAAREGFLNTGQVDSVLRGVIADSWRRSLAGGADPHSGPHVEMSSAQVAECRAAHPLALAMPVVRRLLIEDAADAGLIVALSDAAGRLLWVEGASYPRRRAEAMGFVEGAVWSEAAAGTNAPGTALALDHAVQVFGAEHLADPVTTWSCSAAPVHAPDGSLIGAVDLTGGDEAAAPHNLTLVRTVAATIEAELRVQQLNTRQGSATARPGAFQRIPAGGAAGATSPRPAGRLHLLGHPTGELITPEGTVALRLRHAEILLALTLHPAGLTSEQLDVQLHDRVTAPVTLRAEMSRLRDLLTNHFSRYGQVTLASRPYRLVGRLDSDVAEVRRRLHHGDHRGALELYRGALLPASVAPGVEAARERLRREVRTCLLLGRDPELLLAFAESTDGAEDLEIWEACLRAFPPTSAHTPLVAARVRQLHEELL